MAGKLTAKQQGYVDARMAGANQSDAYRGAYSAGKMTDKQVWEEASKLEKNPKVAQSLAEAREAAAERVVLDRAWVLERLMSNVTNASNVEDYTASNKALELLGKTDELKMFVDRKHVESDNRHNHTVKPVSAFDEFLAESTGGTSEVAPEKPVPN